MPALVLVPSLARSSALRGALLLAALASVAGAQSQLWIQQFGSNDYDFPFAAAADGAGGVYVSGETSGDLGGPTAGQADAFLAHYDGAGNQTWVRQFGSIEWDTALASAPDGSGGVFSSGNTEGDLGGPNAGNADAWLAHYDGAGNRTWIRQIGSPAYDTVGAAVPDGAGGVYLCGVTLGSLGGPSAGNFDAWLAHYDGAGNQTWIRQFGSTLRDTAFGAAADGAGGVYVAGATRGNFGGPGAGQGDAWLARFDSAGNQTWLRKFGTSSDDDATHAAADGAGGVYVGGTTLGSLGGPNAGQVDAWLARFDGAGNQTWIRQFGTIDDDYAYAAAPDESGGVYIGGTGDGSTGGPSAGSWDTWLAHYDGAGDQTWIRQFGSIDSDSGYAVAPDGAGGVYISGETDGSLGGPSAGAFDCWIARYEGALTTSGYCTPAVPNSTGLAGRLNAAGSSAVLANDLTLVASQLPQSSFGYFLTSRMQGHAVGAGGSQGDLCLGGAIGRYVGPGQIKNSGTTGSFALVLDLSTMPGPSGNVAAQPGETWYFQTWHRDANPTSTSNFTDAVSVTLQ